MTIEATIQTALAPLVAGGCWEDFNISPAPQVKPYIVFCEITGVPLNTLDGFSGLTQRRMQIDTYAVSRGSSRAIAATVKAAIAIALPQSINLSYQPLYEPDTKLYRITMDFSLWS